MRNMGRRTKKSRHACVVHRQPPRSAVAAAISESQGSISANPLCRSKIRVQIPKEYTTMHFSQTHLLFKKVIQIDRTTRPAQKNSPHAHASHRISHPPQPIPSRHHLASFPHQIIPPLLRPRTHTHTLYTTLTYASRQIQQKNTTHHARPSQHISPAHRSPGPSSRPPPIRHPPLGQLRRRTIPRTTPPRPAPDLPPSRSPRE